MYLILLGLIAVGAGLLLVYYSVKDKNDKKAKDENWDPKDKGKVIYMFDDEEQDGSGFSDPKSDKPKPKAEPKTEESVDSKTPKKDEKDDQ